MLARRFCKPGGYWRPPCPASLPWLFNMIAVGAGSPWSCIYHEVRHKLSRADAEGGRGCSRTAWQGGDPSLPSPARGGAAHRARVANRSWAAGDGAGHGRIPTGALPRSVDSHVHGGGRSGRPSPGRSRRSGRTHSLPAPLAATDAPAATPPRAGEGREGCSAGHRARTPVAHFLPPRKSFGNQGDGYVARCPPMP